MKQIRCIYTNLCHVCDQAEGDVWKGFVEISTDYIDPRRAVSRVGVGFIECHDMGEVGELGVPLLQADLHLEKVCDESRTGS